MSITSLQCQTTITTNIGDYENLQYVSIIYLLIYLIDIKHVHSFKINQLIGVNLSS